jgi:hypothetical protein
MAKASGAKAGSSGAKANHVKVIKEEIELRRREARDKNELFVGLTDEQIQEKLRSAKSPMITWQSWTGTTAPGGNINYTLGIYNPDPWRLACLFNHVFVGAANVVADPDDALAVVDTRFARLTQPDFDGLAIDPGQTRSLGYVLPVPAGIDRTNYLGNSFLFFTPWNGKAQLFDRSLFVFKVA